MQVGPGLHFKWAEVFFWFWILRGFNEFLQPLVFPTNGKRQLWGFSLCKSLFSPNLIGRLIPEIMSCQCNSTLSSTLFTSKPGPGNLTLSVHYIPSVTKKLDFATQSMHLFLKSVLYVLYDLFLRSVAVGILFSSFSYTPHRIPMFSLTHPVSSSFVTRGFSNLLVSLKEEFAFLLLILLVALGWFPRKGKNGNLMPHRQTRSPQTKFLLCWSLVNCSFQLPAVITCWRFFGCIRDRSMWGKCGQWEISNGGYLSYCLFPFEYLYGESSLIFILSMSLF